MLKTRVITAIVMLAVGGAAYVAVRAQTPAKLTLTVLSGKPDMVTGGDVLVRVSGSTIPTFTLNRRPISPAMQQGMALVTGFPLGRSTLEAALWKSCRPPSEDSRK